MHLSSAKLQETAVKLSDLRVWPVLLAFLAASCLPFSLGHTKPLSSVARARLAAGQPTWVIVEFDATATNRGADTARTQRQLRYDDVGILALRARGYAATKAGVAAGAAGPDATQVHDYPHFPLAVWRISSVAALGRLEAYPGVRAVHENLLLHAVSVSDLPFIGQPQAAAEGATGAGTTIAVIDGGLGSNYLNYPDFGSCTGVNTPSTTCRVVFNSDFYSGAQASTETAHGTNVSAIALGVAPGAKLAMFDVFQGSGVSAADLITALDTIIQDRATYNIVAVNMSLGDTSSNSMPCSSSAQSPFVTPIANTLAAGIAVVVAAGNNGSKTGVADPACVPGVISVGAVYDASYGTLTWAASASSNGQCTDASAADHVTCFSQSASYLSLLAPGSFVGAPTSAFQESGTSQATPHVSGSVAVLRARYPAESLTETLHRLQVSGVSDTDAANGQSTPRINLSAAVDQGTAVALSTSGPINATFQGVSTYTLTVTNSGPLDATGVKVVDTLPAGAVFKSASSGCTYTAPYVTCMVGAVATGASVTLTITVSWNTTGAVYDSATVTTDQVNTSSQQSTSLGVAPPVGDAPLPIWAYALLGGAVYWVGRRRLAPASTLGPGC